MNIKHAVVAVLYAADNRVATYAQERLADEGRGRIKVLT